MTDEHGRRMAALPGGMGVAEDPMDEPLNAGTPRPALTSIAVRRVGAEVTATTTLALNGRILSGSAARTDGDSERAIATATLDAIQELLLGEGSIDSAQIVNIPGRRVAVTVVEFPEADSTRQILVGSALVRGDPEDALARSVLSALNRRLGT